MQLFTSLLPLTALLFLALAVCGTAARSLGARVFHYVPTEQDRMFVSDPSAKVDGIFKKEGDMTFILNSDPFTNDFSDKDDDGRQKRNAVLNTNYLWSDATVPYEISSYFNEKERYTILSAMRHWEEHTCIRFRPKSSSDNYYVSFTSGSRGVCQSFVGRIGRYYQPQGITLGSGCVYFSIIVHEIGHAIGFYHEHNRPDRDEHIEIVHDNILGGLESAFSKYQPGETNLLGHGYDYASIMHYSSDAFSKSNADTIVTKESNIPIGDAQELSPLDIVKANKLYSCGANSTWGPISTTLPTTNLTLPTNITCGQVSNGQLTGTYTPPGHPSYRHNLHCAYVVKVPKGYYLQFKLKNFAIEKSVGCVKDYVQFYYGTELTSHNVLQFYGTTDGRLCDDEGYTWTYIIYSEEVSLLFHTDASGSGTQALEVSFAAQDEDECQYINKCHSCSNLPGGYECVCRDGYYHSVAATTCYDVNECAYANGGCQHKCKNFGGSYECSCDTGYFLQNDNKTCATTLPDNQATISKCGANLTTASGSFQTPNWPQTYDNNIDCEWLIRLPDASKLVEITCGTEAPYGIAGSHPSCTKDYITLYDGHSTQSDSHGPYCGFTQPGTIKMSSSLAKVLFHAGPSHSDSRRGVKCTYKSVNAPLPPTTPPPTLPPTTPPPAQCGGSLTTASGSFQTSNWPETYDNNIDCEWRITLPDLNKLIEIKCEDDPFSIAGTFPECAKDHLKIYDGHSTQDTLKGTFCHFTKPDTMTMSSNRSMAVFHAGPNHSSSRKGFRCTFTSVNPPTVPPTSTSQCGGTLTAASGSLQTPNWPETYPVDVTCVWNIQLPDTTKRVEITFAEGFGIAGNLPDCSKDHLHVHDDSAGTQNGPYCHFTLPPVLVMSSNQARLVFYAGERHSSSRLGFKASYRSV